ncbi:coiled-coil domain-containing protein 62 isoform X2 [Oxyura jamaicensis]|uniref:coiled-coil domain-containing protein 62 isoform X2 n=1 Tax=Oxyura jamaicensis TaxID=8884 RepID=UPI0015A60A8C|nr:coiled-coil domain-containing protein 62 isoform X2 [Oxyura jamaicensis]
MNPARPRSASPQKFSPSFENSTVEKQRRELQVLIAELKAREEELNAMVAVHQRERLAWEDDRQKILTLAERCALLNNELNKRNDIIKSLTKKLKLLESQQSDSKMICEITQQKFEELSQKLTHVTLHCQGLEEENQILRCSVLKLSAKKGQLQAREQELLKKLELKGEDILETTDYVTEFTSKFKLESALHAAKAEEFGLNKEKQDLRLRLRELILETDKLKDDLCEKIKENNKQQEEIIHLKQENVSLKNELALNVEKAKRKDQLLQFAKSKQVRTDTELSSLREIYVKQQRDLQFLHVNLENSQELRQKHEKVVYEKSKGTVFPAPESNSQTESVRTDGTHRVCEDHGTAQVLKSRVENTSEMCEVDNRLLLDASGLEKTTSAHLNRCQKVVKGLAMEEEEKQDVASSSDELDSKLFYEANNTRLLRNREISENEVESRDQQTFESSSPEYWLNITSCVDSQNTLIQKATSDKADNENKTWEERTGILFGQKSKETSVTIHTSESESFSSNFILKKDARWKPISDPEWLKIFKPIKGNGSKLQRKGGLKTAEEMKYASSKSGENFDLNSFHLDSPCFLTSTQKGDRSQRREKFSDANSPLDIGNLSVTEPKNRCCDPSIHKDACYPTSKLQPALAESQQMVADLELSTLLHMSLHCSPNSSSINTTTELAETSQDAVIWYRRKRC